jgi:ribosomal-protein-alanine N-acetyltransferase
MKVILETDRLLLREYVEDDAEAFFELNSDPQVLRFVPDKGLLNVEQARQILIDHPIADYRKYGFGRGACILKSTGEQIGFAGLKYLEEFGEVDVAFRLMRSHWGLGLATEAALASVRFGFADLGLKGIIGLVMPENKASVRVLEKTGLHYVETVTFWGSQFSKYAITSPEWSAAADLFPIPARCTLPSTMWATPNSFAITPLLPNECTRHGGERALRSLSFGFGRR